ncbi:LpqB family beta-propeller domain-containing protein [Ornithinimicrobium sp. F0845]|uniref:LpqB family beta-propeller domain-containing protein n=1 Tax=Ornithinimicrobium sp. F0845 TaxID=2926412 RepID=UPI001FF5D303|nr:LpqB family beta-propeller domain-containing protein [Ornithinimicrobium sp. F0845]MCK0111398.1 LpqB family beta-propeller domain-containing protein [Ornithinimicrobium sp. F0845]
MSARQLITRQSMTRQSMTRQSMTRQRSARRPLRTRLLVVILPVLLALSACAGLPTSDTVRPGLPVQGAPVQNVQALPVGPEADASPEQIVDSFLRASSSFADDHEVARSFLTGDLARQWRPTSSVLIYDGEPELTATEEDETVAAQVSVRGSVDQDGYLVEVPRGTEQTHRFTMQQVAGEWRIAGFPEGGDGVWLSETAFEQQYTSASINYVTPDTGVFVPDVRWFPRGDGLATSLATAQIGRVPEYLDGAATTGISENLQLVASAVPVDPATQTATVDLRGLAIGSSPMQQRELLAQFTQTLRQAPGVNNVLVRSSGRPLEVEGVENPLSDVASTGFEAAEWSVPYGLLRISVELTPVMPHHYQLQDNLSIEDDLPDVPIRWQQLATDENVEEFAGVSVDRETLWRWRNDVDVEMEGVGTGLTTPSFDRSDGLWVAGRSTTGPRVWVISRSESLSQAVARPLEAPWLDPDQQVTEFRPAADDRRALIVLEDMDTEEVQIGITGIVRDQDGRATALTEPYWVAPTLTSVSSAVWSSQTELFVLGTQASDTSDRPFVVHIGGWLQPLRLVAQATEVRAVPSDEGAARIVLSERGRIYTQDRNDWGIGRNGDDVIIPGT